MMSGADVEEGMKVCTKCKTEKPKSEFYKHSTTRDGLTPRCKQCKSAADKERRLTNKLKNARDADLTGTKICAKCKEEKTQRDFYKDFMTRDGLQYWCKSCMRAYKKSRLTNKRKNARDADITNVKICVKCKAEKPKRAFHKNDSSNDGLQSWCKQCSAESVRLSQLNNRKKNACGVDVAGTKTCSQCREKKEKAEFGANLGSHDGLNAYCKECGSHYWRAYQERNRRANETARARHDGVYVAEKYCSACGEKKLSDAFYARVTSKDGLDAYCKACHRRQSKSYRDRQSAMSRTFAARSREWWSSEDDQFVITNYGIMTQYQIAIDLGRTLYAVKTRVRALRRNGKLA